MNNYTLNYHKPSRIRKLLYLSIALLCLYIALSIYGVYNEIYLLLALTIPLILKALFMMYFYGLAHASTKAYIRYEEGILTINRPFLKNQNIALKQVSFAKFIGHDLMIETDQKKVFKISLDYLTKDDRMLLENTFKDVFL